MTAESDYLVALARRLTDAYLVHTRPRAALLTGSAAVGDSDRCSDLDLILYYNTLPAEKTVEAAREQLGATDVKPLDDPSEREFGEAYSVAGVECQVGHVTIAAWEEDMASVLDGLAVESPIQQALGGLVDGGALHGDELIRHWQAKAADYPDALARAMVTHYLRFFPLWYVADRLALRDATIWEQQVRVESAQRILGVLAGLNRLYYSTYQLKRTHAFIGKMSIAPARLAGRLEALFGAERTAAIEELENLVRETVDLVGIHMPELDTAHIQLYMGERARPWSPEVP
jgi:hypothetical protein